MSEKQDRKWQYSRPPADPVFWDEQKAIDLIASHAIASLRPGEIIEAGGAKIIVAECRCGWESKIETDISRSLNAWAFHVNEVLKSELFVEEEGSCIKPFLCQQ